MSCEEPRHPVEVLAEEFAERIRLGERPLVDDYAARHADWADEIRKLFPVLLLMEQPGGKTNGEAPGTATPLVTSIEPAQQLGEYRIVREIGRGGMGIVYEAEQVPLGRRVALKILPPAAALSQIHLARFLRETQAAARLHHTNIVPIFGVGEQDGVPYYAMQFIEGQSLQELVRRLQRHHTACVKSPDNSQSGGALADSLAESMVREQFAPASDEGRMTTASTATPPGSTPGIRTPFAGATSRHLAPSMGEPYYRNVARIGLQVADALSHAHAQGVIHRDIKPSNLLLDTQGTVWITDFGLAKAEGSEDLTASGDVVGTLRYLAPERFRGQTDARSDVYSLGLVLYELVVLRPAFTESDRNRLLQSMLQAEPAPPRQLSPQIPRDLETIILKCMHREPERRYSSAAALADDVRRYLAYEPIRARRLTVPERMGRWCRRNPAVATLSTLALILLLSGLGAVGWQWRRAENQRRLAEANFQKARQAVNRCFDTVTNNPALQEPGMEEVRKVLLETALPYYQEFLVERRDDPTLSGELARTHSRVGYIQQRIGTPAAAIAAYQHARDVYARSVEARPGDKTSAVELTKCHYALAKLYQSISQLDEAEMALKECVATRAKLVHDFPGFPDDQNDLADGHQALGILYREAGRLAEAESAFDTAISLRIPIAQDYPAYQLGLAADYCERYIFYENSGRHREARLDILASVARLNELHQNEPENPEYQDRLAVSYNTLGRFLLYVSNATPQETEAAYLKALELRESLVREHYRVQAYQAHLATVCNNLGLLFALTNPERAGEYYNRALEVREQLASAHPKVASYQFDVARTYHDMGVWYARTDRAEHANEAYEKALSVLDPMVENRPWTTEWAVVRASTLHNLADLAREQRDSSKSLHYCQKASHALDELIEHEPNHNRALWYQMLVHSVRARVLTFAGRCDEALQDWDRAIDLTSDGLRDPVRASRASTSARQGDYISAINQAQDLITRNPRSPASHVLAAQVYALAVMGVRADTNLSADERSRQAEQCGRQAVALLTEAATLGHYRSHANSQNNLRELKVDTEFDSLRDRADFQQLLDQLTSQ